MLAEHRSLEQPPAHLADLQVSDDGRVEFWHGRADYLESNKVSIQAPGGGASRMSGPVLFLDRLLGARDYWLSDFRQWFGLARVRDGVRRVQGVRGRRGRWDGRWIRLGHNRVRGRGDRVRRRDRRNRTGDPGRLRRCRMLRASGELCIGHESRVPADPGPNRSRSSFPRNHLSLGRRPPALTAG